MDNILDITYYMHSGFSCAIGDILLIFDYWQGEHGELRENKRIQPEELSKYSKVYVFISHSHPDHLDPVVYEWAELPNIEYIISYELPEECKGIRMEAGNTITLSEDMQVTAFESTDLGIAFLVDIKGIHIFHAGDLNFWHWREESTAQEIEEAETAFKEACEPIIGKPIDVAFFPVDPRQGRLFDAGANYFALTVKPRLMIPMHFWNRNELIVEYARRSRSRETEIIVMTHQGEKMRIEFSKDGFMTINILSHQYPQNEMDEIGIESMTGEEGNPFSDSDLPVKIDDENEK